MHVYNFCFHSTVLIYAIIGIEYSEEHNPSGPLAQLPERQSVGARRPAALSGGTSPGQ